MLKIQLDSSFLHKTLQNNNKLKTVQSIYFLKKGIKVFGSFKSNGAKSFILVEGLDGHNIFNCMLKIWIMDMVFTEE